MSLLRLVGRVSDSPSRQSRSRTALAFACILLPLASCGSSRTSAPPAAQSDKLDPVLTAPTLGPDPAPRDSRAATNSRAAEKPKPPVPGVPPPASVRTDGRPSWWLDEPSTTDGRVFLAAEALGPDVRAARRAAVDSAMASLERLLGAPPTDDRVHAALVCPLPSRADAPGASRFVGYVLVSAPAPAR